MTSTKSKNQLIKENRELKRKVDDLKNDINVFHNFFRSEMRIQMSNLAENKNNSPSSLMQRMVNTIGKAEPFYMWW